MELLNGGTFFGYFGKYPDSDGDYRATTTISNAMVVEIMQSEGVYGFKIQVSEASTVIDHAHYHS